MRRLTLRDRRALKILAKLGPVLLMRAAYPPMIMELQKEMDLQIKLRPGRLYQKTPWDGPSFTTKL